MANPLRSLITPEAKAVRAPESTPDLFGVAGSEKQRITNRAADRHTQAYGGTDAIDWVMDCVNLYAETAANATYHFERFGRVYVQNPSAPRAPADAKQAPGDLANLFARPNPWMDYSELIELSVIDLLLAGEFLWYKFGDRGDGKPLALYRLQPALTDVIPGNNYIKSYSYKVPGEKPMEIPAAQVLHVKRPNPHDPYRGLGVIAGGPGIFDMELSLAETMASYYRNGTRLSGVLESDRTVPESTLQKIKKQWRGMYAGSYNAYAVATLERGLKFRSISSTAEQAQFKQIAEWSRDRICHAFKTPVVLIGEVGGSTDRQAIKEAQRIWDNKHARGLFNRIQKQISFGLTQAWGFDFVIEHEYVMPIEDKLDLGQAFGALPGVRVREVRAKVDLPPLGDERDDIVLNLPGEDREDGGFPDKNLSSEAGRPPKASSTQAFPAAGQPLPTGASARAEARRDQKAAEAASATLARLSAELHGEEKAHD
jgi:HK97 family phage portal protein